VRPPDALTLAPQSESRVKDGCVEIVQPHPENRKECASAGLSGAAALVIKKELLRRMKIAMPRQLNHSTANIWRRTKRLIAERGLESTNTPNVCRYSIISRHIML
jgi:hypothetical protein